ncbi:MAG TPA: cellulose synthase family protein [Candidatus Polarisedimenticolaceae bacterium]|nr:cellulose synthase family protein [Candidatus Polarisedimenticolaceae bacterium]
MADELVVALRWGTLGLYFACLGVLTLYGIHRWYLVALYLRHRDRAVVPPGRLEPLPPLTVQLPLFNEMYVVERLIDAVCALDYPRDRLEIQVLDDSTDETTALVRRKVEQKVGEGFDIVHLCRTDRGGFKAGALETGQRRAKGELIAVFDADFVPRPDFARQLVHHFVDPRVGMVQARWGHLNADHSPLTRVQSMLLDGHFVIEHTARNRSGRFFNFNGTAGIWRRECIVDAGGWQHDTLTEDLDLSYRAQLGGWRFVFVNEHVAPAELPIEIGSFKSQQHRWAKGSIQTARKLLPAILTGRLPFRVKLESAVHLTANVGYVLMVLLALLVVPAVYLRAEISPWWIVAVDLPLFTFSSLSVAAFYVLAHGEATGRRGGIARWVPFLMAVGIGLSINNARAVIEALAGRDSEFHRTPKYNLRRGENIAARSYRVTINRDTWVELALALYFSVATAAVIASGLWGAVPFLLLFVVGYSFTALLALRQAARRAAWPV